MVALITSYEKIVYVNLDGSSYSTDKNLDIVSRFQESIDENWMIEKAAYKCSKDSKNKQEWSDGFVEGIKYSMNHQFTNKVDEEKLDKLAWDSLKVLNGDRDTVSQDVASMMAGFKIGYRKAIEEHYVTD